MNTPTNANEARKLDTHFYADAEDGSWGVFGDNTGFCYELVMDKGEAEKMAFQMNGAFEAAGHVWPASRDY
jgi:hypothetical protein